MIHFVEAASIFSCCWSCNFCYFVCG